jgi:general stress protein CsbA
MNEEKKAKDKVFVGNTGEPSPDIVISNKLKKWLVALAIITLVISLTGSHYVTIVLGATVLALGYAKLKHHQVKPFLLAVAVVSLSIIMGAGVKYIAYTVGHSKADHTYAYNTNNIDEYKLKSFARKSSISISKPKEITLGVESLKQGSAIAWLAHKTKSNGKDSSFSYVTISSVQSALAGSKSYQKALNQIFSVGSGDAYDKATTSIVKFITDNSSSSYRLSLGKATPFSSSNISKNAWSFDFTSIYQNKRDKNSLADLKGKVVFVLGKKSFYYVLIDSVTDNWNSNQEIWNKVVDSIKIDQ